MKADTLVLRGDDSNHLGFPGGSDGKESTCNAGDLGLFPGLVIQQIFIKFINKCIKLVCARDYSRSYILIYIIGTGGKESTANAGDV